MTVITLLTDFGLQDEYVGVLKGSILSGNPQAVIVDISHGIDAQDIRSASHALKAAYSYFPPGSTHVAVVDPGVGTERNILAARIEDYVFLAPDNGLLWPILNTCGAQSIHRVENESLFRHPVSPTFHGRDIFAPVAAQLSKGLPLTEVGPATALERIASLEDLDARSMGKGTVEGQVVTVDRFGNLITDIHAELLAVKGAHRPVITIGDRTIRGLTDTYAKGKPDEIIAVLGSRNTVEIAINGGSAARNLEKEKGEIVQVKFDAP